MCVRVMLLLNFLGLQVVTINLSLTNHISSARKKEENIFFFKIIFLPVIDRLKKEHKFYSDTGMSLSSKTSKILLYYTESNMTIWLIVKNVSLLRYTNSLLNLENQMSATCALCRSTLYDKIHLPLQCKDTTWSLESGCIKYKNCPQQIL